MNNARVYLFLIPFLIHGLALNRHYRDALKCPAHIVRNLPHNISVKMFCEIVCPGREPHCQEIVREQHIAKLLIREDSLRTALEDKTDLLSLIDFSLYANTIGRTVSIIHSPMPQAKLCLLQLLLYIHLNSSISLPKGTILMMEMLFVKLTLAVQECFDAN